MKTRPTEHHIQLMETEIRLAQTLRLGPPTQAPVHISRVPDTSVFPAGNREEKTIATGKPRILIVDNESTTALLTLTMRRECQIQTVSSAAQVMETARHPDQRPDLILLDIMAPTREGLEICRQLKADEMTQAIPVILIADRGNGGDEARALQLGAEDCITRPLRLEVVEARIRNQLRIKIRTVLLERYANQDSLTCIANRRCFDLALDAEWRRGIREERPLSLVMVDVDCFKQFNDRYGHREGDHCLRRVAKAMAHVLTRPADLLARYGGEEFVAILPGTDLVGARWMGERLRNAVLELQIPQQRPDGSRQVTISVGCASMLPSADLSSYSLLQVADDQLYLAKHSGRNCVRGLAVQTA
jgi:diguanylate cyclase (GGDEF)-like protein